MKFPKLVIEEAKALKKHTTEIEKANLNFGTLNADNVNGCIYGQMTGHCFSHRAVELIERSCKKVYHTNSGFDKSDIKLNGTPVGKYRRNDGTARLFAKNTTYWSPIEVFIMNALPAQKLKLIKFLKGEIKTL